MDHADAGQSASGSFDSPYSDIWEIVRITLRWTLIAATIGIITSLILFLLPAAPQLLYRLYTQGQTSRLAFLIFAGLIPMMMGVILLADLGATLGSMVGIYKNIGEARRGALVGAMAWCIIHTISAFAILGVSRVEGFMGVPLPSFTLFDAIPIELGLSSAILGALIGGICAYFGGRKRRHQEIYGTS